VTTDGKAGARISNTPLNEAQTVVEKIGNSIRHNPLQLMHLQRIMEHENDT